MVDQQYKRLNFYKASPFPLLSSHIFRDYIETFFFLFFFLFIQAELNALRHLILDVSCLDQDLDMRLVVDSKSRLTNLSVSWLCLFQENEMRNLKQVYCYKITCENMVL